MKKLLFLGILWAGAANAQFTPGQILTAGELNSQFALYAPLAGATFTGGISATGITGTPISGSTGSFTTLSASGTVTLPAGSVPLSEIATQAANTILSNATAGTASPTAIAAPSCSTTSSALLWTTSSGLSCNTTINASSLGGTAAASYALLASPTFTGTPAAPTAAAGTNTTQIATTANVVSNFATPPVAGYGSATPEPVSATTMNASGNDALLYTNSSTQSIPNAVGTTITGWTKSYDRVNTNFNASTGTFTAPASGAYVVSGAFQLANTITSSSIFEVETTCNGVAVAESGSASYSTAPAPGNASIGGVVCILTAGQTIVLKAFQNTGSAVALGSTGGANWISIYRLP